jgi:hypothetical protein
MIYRSSSAYSFPSNIASRSSGLSSFVSSFTLLKMNPRSAFTSGFCAGRSVSARMIHRPLIPVHARVHQPETPLLVDHGIQTANDVQHLRLDPRLVPFAVHIRGSESAAADGELQRRVRGRKLLRPPCENPITLSNGPWASRYDEMKRRVSASPTYADDSVGRSHHPYPSRSATSSPAALPGMSAGDSFIGAVGK